MSNLEKLSKKYLKYHNLTKKNEILHDKSGKLMTKLLKYLDGFQDLLEIQLNYRIGVQNLATNIGA